VILLDIMLPKLDGFEVLKRLRADSQLSHIPVFMLSNRSSAEDVQSAFSLGAREFFTKGSSSLQNVVMRIRNECGFKKLIAITANAESAKSISAALQHRKLLCRVCTFLAEAMTTVEHGVPDLVVLDANLAGAVVFNLLQQLKTTPATQALPVIIVTDEPQKFHRADGFVAPARIDHDLRSTALKLVGLPDSVEAALPEHAAVA
jgi:hypothetical protein